MAPRVPRPAGKTPFRRTRSNLTRKVDLSGPLFMTSQVDAFKEHILASLAPAAETLKQAIQAAARVKTGAMRDKVKVTMRAAKGKATRVTILVESTATREPTKGDPPKRYGKVQYAIFEDHETGFISDTVERQHVPLLEALRAGVSTWIEKQNAAGAQRASFTVPLQSRRPAPPA